jgi:branched-chain amino acid transport system ATP-binding protein
VYENLLVGAHFGAGQTAADAHRSCIAILDLVQLTHLADVESGKLRLLDRKRLELARGLATKPKVLLLDEIAGGLTDLECENLIGVIRTIRSSGVGIIWIEHIVHALLAVVDRLAVLSAGMMIANGDPHAVFNSRDVQDLYMGTPA